MMEADELCDRVAILSHGKVLACDSPAALKRSLQQQSLFEIGLAPRLNSAAADYQELARLPGVARCVVEEGEDGILLKAALQEEAVIGPLVQEIVRRHGHIQNLRKIEPTLEEVFIRLTGHGLAEEEKAP
jgi:ABC-2 type transport system ATP-binding protein